MAITIELIPRTTGIFTPPSSCQSLWTYEASAVNSVPGGLLIQNAGSVSQDSECFPSSVYDYDRASAQWYYSPGYCPEDYYTPVSAVSVGTSLIICCRRFGCSICIAVDKLANRNMKALSHTLQRSLVRKTRSF